MKLPGASTRPLRRRLPGSVLLLATLLLAGCRGTLFAALNSTDRQRGIEQQRSIVFDAAHRLSLDVYRPIAATPLAPAQVKRSAAPIVVFFYGGDWTHGERQWYRFVGTALAARGVITVIPDYRKYPQVKMPGFMRDAARAVAWVRVHAATLGGDPHDIFVMGHSSGGQIAALLATDPRWLAPYGLRPRDLAGFIGLAGCYDFVPIAARDRDMLGIFGRTAAEQREGQPVAFVHGHEPPMLLLQGSADREVDPANSVALDKAMRAEHEDVTLRLYPGVGHMSLIFALSRPLHGHAPTRADILDFIHRHPQARRSDVPRLSPS